MNPNFPLYIVSKGRYDTRLTAKSLEKMGVPYRIIVEPQEVELYAQYIDRDRILPLDMSYKDKYDTCDDGDKNKTGPGAARNFAWDHSISEGHAYHWVMDDNINGFWRYNHNLKVRVGDGTIFRCMEDFIQRYENVAMAGPNYYMFIARKEKNPPVILNTRIYSCNLIRNDMPFRWRGRWNEDTILSLDMLKAGYCTIQFNTFLQWEMPTQMIKGGNTDEFYWTEGEPGKGERYAKSGTAQKSEMLVKVHPDVSKVVFKFGRIHHHVDYKGLKQRNKLIRKRGLIIPDAVNDYGMKIVPNE